MTLSCIRKEHNAAVNLEFKKPVIIYSPQTDKKKEFLAPNSMAPSHPLFAGKYHFNDTITLDLNKRFNCPEQDLLVEYSLNQLPDSLDINGLELIPDYEKEIYYNEAALHPTWQYDKIFAYFPVYLVNSTTSNKVYFGKDLHGFGIQEAIDTSRLVQNWQPIEYKAITMGCGNGEWGIIIRPGEFVIFLMKKYRGPIKTKGRIRIANGPTIYVSKPFDAFINQEQFKPNSFLTKFFKETENEAPANYFFGASIQNYYPGKK